MTATTASKTPTETDRLVAELAWLVANPEFEERPATLSEFLGPEYLDLEDDMRSRIRSELVAIFGDVIDPTRISLYPEAMITGGIGIGKTFIASVILPYMAHWVLCLKNPQKYFHLAPGSRIAFMQMSTSKPQALEVVFGDIKARIEHSPWFTKKYPMNAKFTNQIRFAKDIWILPGDSAETTFEGYNILGAILDEMDSHKLTIKGVDYADIGYDTISNRITSRFGKRGFFLLIGQMKKSVGFAGRKYAEFMKRDDAYVAKLTLWESYGLDHEWFVCDQVGPHFGNETLLPGAPCPLVHTFAYDTKRRAVVSDELAAAAATANIIRVPEYYRSNFATNPEKALRDLAGIPPVVGDPFISMMWKVEEATDRWIESHGGEYKTPVDPGGTIADWFIATDTLKRVVHMDIAYSGEGDALGFAMGHVQGVKEADDGELKPYIVIDLLLRMKAPPGGEIELGLLRHIIYNLRGHNKFRIKRVTMDNFQGVDMRQQLTKRRFESDIVSCDKTLVPYYDLRDAIYEDRIEIPKYITYLEPGGTDLIEVAVKELSELVDAGKKIDHPDGGSKDVADALAGVVFTLMGDRTYRRKVVSLDARRDQRAKQVVNGSISHPAYVGSSGLVATPAPHWNGRQ